MHGDVLRCLLVLSCLAAAEAVSAPRVSQAQAAPGAQAELVGIEVSYEASPGCPERDAFVKNLEARRRGAPAGSATDTVRLEVQLSEVAGRVEGSIAATSTSGVRSARRVEAATCAEAADALAFIAALALVGVQVEQVSPEVGGDAPAASRTKRASRSRVSEQPATLANEPSEDSTIEATDTETEVASESETRAASDAEVEPAEETTVEAATVEPHATERTSRAHLMLAGGAGSGVMPALQSLLELSLSLQSGGDGELLLSAQAGVRVSPDQTRTFDMGVVSFGWWSGLGSLCLGVGGARLSASGCAMVEAGAMAASATKTDNPRDELRAWLALGPGLSFAFDASNALRLQLRAEALLPLTRYRFELPRESAVHEPSRLGLRIGLGAGLRLW